MSAAGFSDTYAQARRRFMDAARAVDADLYTYLIKSASTEELAVDVAVVGTDSAPALVVSSGIHGVEGYFGSAVQHSLLKRLRNAAPQNKLRWVLIHGLNPYGFAHLRRVNEDNVDLNRNFMAHAGGYTGAPAGYARLDGLLNPPSAPTRFEPFRLKALWHILRTGLQSLKDTVAGGQYAYPRGLFYGGNAPCATTRIVQQHCDAWLASTQHILHIDLHTGLGKFAKPTLLLEEAAASAHHPWYAETFGADRVEPLAQPQGTAYQASGVFGQWMQQHFITRNYRFMTAEFGTYDVIRVLAALRAENRAHHYCAPDDAAYQRAKRELRECFCPASAAWRSEAVTTALNIVDQGARALTP